MKKLFILLVMIGSLTSCAVRKTSDPQEILAVLESQRQAWNRGDMEAYMQGYERSDSLVFVGKNGPEYGWQTTLDNYKKSYPDKSAMGFLTFDIKKVKILSSDHAFVLGAWHLKREKDEPQGWFTLLLKKSGGKWKVVADHSS
ncbi:MAG: nuclear transport factor 2 family protein [Daejeonella sp.]|uniref:YybH family protein n=1 Tax=Daejeonella sp. TaxID=2805397 RepID=UPI003C742904